MPEAAVRLDKTNQRESDGATNKAHFVDKYAQNSVNVSNERLYQKKDADRKPRFPRIVSIWSAIDILRQS
jgi:hypothetical protein